jgi:hypothetical protein
MVRSRNPIESFEPSHSPATNPALEAFVASLGPGRVWAQVLIQPSDHGFTLRHVLDRDVPPEKLKGLALAELRKLAMFTAEGQFRPLRSSPDLPRDWIFTCISPEELWRALQELYPSSIADWFAARDPNPPVTNYRDFTNRQTGMYRITQLLSDEQAATVTRAACHARFCLKQRLWTVPGLATESQEEKSSIPCLEPCAILLELARKAARIEQEAKLGVQFSKSELQSLLAAAEVALESSPTKERTGNVGAASNARRLQLLIEKFKKYGEAEPDREKEI